MADATDTIGVVRDHRWLRADAQVEALRKAGARIIVSLKGGKARPVDMEQLRDLVRPGTRVCLVHAFLLADPRKRHRPGGMKADLAAKIKLLVDKRGGVLVDMDTGLTTANAGHRKALMALAEDQISRSNRGLRSALNGARSKGRPRPAYTAEQMKDAKAAWRNVMDYPTWTDVKAALPQDPVKFTPARAYKLWGPRIKRKSKR